MARQRIVPGIKAQFFFPQRLSLPRAPFRPWLAFLLFQANLKLRRLRVMSDSSFRGWIWVRAPSREPGILSRGPGVSHFFDGGFRIRLSAMLTSPRIRLAALACALLGERVTVPGAEPVPGESPVRKGLSEKYPGDAGIEKDPRVLFAESFEDGSVEDLGKRWDQASDKGGKVIAFASDAPDGSAGKRSLAVAATLGENTGGHLYRRLPRAVDSAYARFYVKFPQAAYIHHFVTLGGYRPETKWPQGGAGERPRGDDRITVGIEPFGDDGRARAPGLWNFYAYWHEMKISADRRYWGNGLRPERPAPVPLDRWQCVEVYLKMNSAPEKSDGELALWLDGRLVMDLKPGSRRGKWTGLGFVALEKGGEAFEGFRWRTSDELKINFFWLLHYMTEECARRNGAKGGPTSSEVRFDHIVVATEYVGPIAPAAKAAR